MCFIQRWVKSVAVSKHLSTCLLLQAIEFPVVATFAGEAPRVVVKCLEAKEVPLLQVCSCLFNRTILSSSSSIILKP